MLRQSIFFLFLTISLGTAQSAVSSDLLEQLYSDSNWVLRKSDENELQIYNKKIPGRKIPAVMVKTVTDVSIRYLTAVILDVGNYTNTISDSYLKESVLLGQDQNYLDNYQFLDLPIISNRHYIHRMYQKQDTVNNSIRIDWMLLSEDSEYSTYLDSLEVLHGHPVYVKSNTGGWEITQLPGDRIEVIYRAFFDPAGIVPAFFIKQGNLINAPNAVNDMIREAKRRSEVNR